MPGGSDPGRAPGAQPREDTVSSSLVEQVNAVVDKAASGAISYLEALRTVSRLYLDSGEVLGDELSTTIEDIIYALAYNALIQGADPGEVRSLVPGGVWDRLVGDGSLSYLLEYRVAEALARGDLDEANRIYKEYGGYLSSEAKKLFQFIASPLTEKLEKAIESGDAEQLYQVIREIEEAGLYDEYKLLLAKAGLDLDEIKREATRTHIINLLSQTETPQEAREILRKYAPEAREAGLEALASDLEHVVQALEAARRGDAEAVSTAVDNIADEDLLRYTLTKTLAQLANNDPEWPSKLSPEAVERFDRALARAGYDVRVEDLARVAEASSIVSVLGEMTSQGRYDEALSYWLSQDPILRELAAALLGSTPGEVEEALRGLARGMEAVEALLGLGTYLDNGDYAGAYEYWMGLPGWEQEAIAGILGVDAAALASSLGLLAGLQALQGLEDPTLAEVRDTLARYIPGEEAERIARELLEDTSVYKVKKLIDEGRYEEAIGRIAGDSDLSREDRGLLLGYLIATVGSTEGPEALAELIQAHRDKLEGLVSPEVLQAADLVASAPELAGEIVVAIEEVASGELAERINQVLDDFNNALEAGDHAKAKQILESNRDLLVEIPTEYPDASLYDVMAESLALAEAGNTLFELMDELDSVVKSESPESIITGTRRVIQRAEEALEKTRKLAHMPREAVRQLVESLNTLISYAYAYMAQALLSRGRAREALEAAEKAYKHNPDMKQFYHTLLVMVEASKDPARLEENIKCLAQAIAPPKPGGRKYEKAKIT